MNKILAIISEYNPLHNGHLYHIKESQKIVDPNYTICIIGGNFTQRRRAITFRQMVKG